MHNDKQQNVIQHSGTQRNNTKHNDTQYNVFDQNDTQNNSKTGDALYDKNVTLSTAILLLGRLS
jgi:hypothetical protein